MASSNSGPFVLQETRILNIPITSRTMAEKSQFHLELSLHPKHIQLLFPPLLLPPKSQLSISCLATISPIKKDQLILDEYTQICQHEPLIIQIFSSQTDTQPIQEQTDEPVKSNDNEAVGEAHLTKKEKTQIWKSRALQHL